MVHQNALTNAQREKMWIQDKEHEFVYQTKISQLEAKWGVKDNRPLLGRTARMKLDNMQNFSNEIKKRYAVGFGFGFTLATIKAIAEAPAYSPKWTGRSSELMRRIFLQPTGYSVGFVAGTFIMFAHILKKRFVSSNTQIADSREMYGHWQRSFWHLFTRDNDAKTLYDSELVVYNPEYDTLEDLDDEVDEDDDDD